MHRGDDISRQLHHRPDNWSSLAFLEWIYGEFCSIPRNRGDHRQLQYSSSHARCDRGVLARSHGGRSIELHVVDNASPNGDASVLSAALAERGWTSRVHLRSETQNHGFGRGNNLVLTELMRRARRRLPMRSCSIPTPGLIMRPLPSWPTFSMLIRAAAAAGASISSPEGVPVASAFRFPGIVSTFASALCLGPVSRLLRAWEVSLPPAMGTQRVDWVPGAAVMLRLSAVQRAGYFDPSYFLYFEEVDLMRQLTRQGGEVWHVGEARVAHTEGAATGVRGASTRRLPAYWYHSWQHYFDKNRAAAVWPCSSRRPGTPALPPMASSPRCAVASPMRRSGSMAISGDSRSGRCSGSGRCPMSEVEMDLELRDAAGVSNCNPTDIGFWALVAEDFRTNDSDWTSQGLLGAVLASLCQLANVGAQQTAAGAADRCLSRHVQGEPMVRRDHAALHRTGGASGAHRPLRGHGPRGALDRK